MTNPIDGFRKSVSLALVLAVVAAALLPASARADLLPSRPITLWGDRLVIGGDLTMSFGSPDDRYFNTLDYDHSALNISRIGISVEFRPDDRIAVVTQVVDEVALRSEPFDFDRNVFRIYALFVRVRPWRDRSLVIQAGRIPPVFGAFARQDYGAGNPLIGLPLAYHAPTILRDDALPASASDLLRQRGRGWRVNLPVGPGSEYPDEGLPIVSPQRWDTGVQASWGGGGPIEVSGAVTSGTLSNPLVGDDNGGKQVSGRVAFRPTAGLTFGVSGSRGAFIRDDALHAVPAADRGGSYTQRAFGADAEYSHGYWLLRAETIVSLWRVPAIDAPRLDDSLRAWATSVEGRVKLTPRFYLAARLDRMTFSDVKTDDGLDRTWDAALGRVEIGGGYSLTRNVRAKLSYQHNWRDTTRFNKADLVAAQLAYWF
jgi:hypothetical protein